ncbi:MAG: DHA2 family efflux MFS transporter permease subunit [Spirochaetales bacterium]|nr:DHA2 family efflux MFS transporter permease subunit [Spirochaetales bacterium]
MQKELLNASPSPVRPAEKWFVLAAVVLGMFMSLIDHTTVNVTIARLQAVFKADLQAVQWVSTVYMLTQAAVIPTAPFLASRFGIKRAYVGTLVAFLLGCLLCGFAWNLPSLIFFRFIQGIGGGVLLPLSTTLLYQAFPAKERGMASSILGIFMMIAAVIGPVMGGALVGAFGWQFAFFINVPVGLITVFLAQWLLRKAPAEKGMRFDIPGFVTASAGCVALLFAVSTFSGSLNPLVNAAVFAGGVGLLLAFSAIERRTIHKGDTPLLDIRRYGDRAFTLSNIANIFVTMVRFGSLFLIPIYLQTIRLQTTAQAGMILAAQALLTVLLLPLSGWLVDHKGPKPVVITGAIVLACAAAVMTILSLDTAIGVIIAILGVLGFALAFVQQLGVAALLKIDQSEKREIANATTLFIVLQAVAAPMGIALVSSLVQLRGQVHAAELAVKGIAGELLQRQSSLLAMREAFLIAIGMALLAMAVMWGIPAVRKKVKPRQD